MRKEVELVYISSSFSPSLVLILPSSSSSPSLVLPSCPLHRISFHVLFRVTVIVTCSFVSVFKFIHGRKERENERATRGDEGGRVVKKAQWLTLLTHLTLNGDPMTVVRDPWTFPVLTKLPSFFLFFLFPLSLSLSSPKVHTFLKNSFKCLKENYLLECNTINSFGCNKKGNTKNLK